MQTNNRLFDDLAALMTNAAGAAKGVGDELGQMMRQQGERVAADLDLASREELDVVKDIARQALERVEKLEQQLSALESRLEQQSETAGRERPTNDETAV